MGAAETRPIAKTVAATTGVVGCIVKMSTGERDWMARNREVYRIGKRVTKNGNCLKSLRGDQAEPYRV